MKKLVLIMVFVLLMAVFIAFNYLLVDRESKINDLESLKYANASSTDEINAKNREIKRLETEINQYETDSLNLEREKEQLSQKNLQMENDKAAEAQKASHRIDILNFLIQNADIGLFAAPVKKWVEAMDTGDYAEAYRLQYEKASLQSRQESLEDYTETLKDNIKSIKIKEVLLDKEAGKTEGEIVLTVSLDVKLTENAKPEVPRFTEGLNEMKVKLDYDAVLNEFVIIEITE